MSRYFAAAFNTEDDILGVVRTLRRNGYEPRDVYAPYALHGLDRAAGLRPSRIGWVCAIGGLGGAAAILLFEIWSSSVSWALNVGGKPYDSFPAFVPVMFEVGVLCGALGSVAALFLRSRLYPGKTPEFTKRVATDDEFVVLLEERDASFDAEFVRQTCSGWNAVAIERGDF